MTSTPPPARDLVVVDVETSGLDPRAHVVLEVAAIDLRTGRELAFVPHPSEPDWYGDADPDALAVNRYYERHVYRNELDLATTRQRWSELADMLDGTIVCGASPWFDTAFLDPILWPDRRPRRDHHLRDLTTLAVGVLDLDPAVPWSQRHILDQLDITNDEPHSAAGDARTCAAAFRALLSRPGER